MNITVEVAPECKVWKGVLDSTEVFHSGGGLRCGDVWTMKSRFGGDGDVFVTCHLATRRINGINRRGTDELVKQQQLTKRVNTKQPLSTHEDGFMVVINSRK